MQEMLCAIHEEWTGDVPEALRKIKRRVAFHCGREASDWIGSSTASRDLRAVVYTTCAPKCRAYEQRCAARLGALADSLGVERKGFWTKDDLRTMIMVRAHGNLESPGDVQWIRETYDQTLRDLNRSDDVVDERALTKLCSVFMHPDRFLYKLGPTPEIVRERCKDDPAARGALERIERGSRLIHDLYLVRRVCTRPDVSTQTNR